MVVGGLSSIVGDPSLNGWATFFVYLVAAWLCAANARQSAALAEIGGRRVALAQSRRRFWIVLAALLLLLGLTRQLDLQALAAQLTRDLLHQDGFTTSAAAFRSAWSPRSAYLARSGC
jgi:hypothetical protein